MSLIVHSGFFLLWLSVFSCVVNAQQKDYLDDDWGTDFDVSLSRNELSSEPTATADWMDTFREQTVLTLKSEFAYQDEITIARTQVRFDASVRPFAQSFLKLDLQYSFYQQQDDLVLSRDSVQHAVKINDAWFQYTHDACNAKAGRQKLFWGTVEGSYALDVVMPLDLTEPLLTDFSLIRRSQDMLVFTCFMSAMDVEVFFTPAPALDQATIRQSRINSHLEDELGAEWGGRLTKHIEGADIGIYFARLYENTPYAVIDFNTMSVSAYQLQQFDLLGLSVVSAFDRLLLEVDFSYQEERKTVSTGLQRDTQTLKYRSEVAFGFEYTTETNHLISAGVWFYSYLSPVDPDKSEDTEVWNVNWSRQYLNDDLTLSGLALWQKQPDIAQITIMADYLWDDFWSSSLALSYKAPSSDFDDATINSAIRQGWGINLGVDYQF
jgi:hypothetical protein